nr:reverse transcriptase domain-containing protein [Tanacetum cinerariifolium]
MQEVVKKEIMKLLDFGIIYPIADSPWVSHILCVPKKGGITVVTNENDELVPTRTITGWRVCIDYRKLNEATAKDHFPLSFMDQIETAEVVEQETLKEKTDSDSKQEDEKCSIPGLCPVLVHRLGRGTSGILLCANTKMEEILHPQICVFSHIGVFLLGMDIAKITRKEPKPGQKRTRERKEYTRVRNYQAKSIKVNIGQPWYKMVFVLFTGMDNHHRRDPAMKIAVKKEFCNSRHRLCIGTSWKSYLLRTKPQLRVLFRVILFLTPKGEMKAITTRSGVAYEGPSIPTNPSPKKVAERETEETTDKEQTNFQGSTAHIQPPVTPILEPDDKLFELAKIPLNENCSAMLLIPCDFWGMDVCHALVDLGASINLMPLSIWKKLSLSELTPTRMTLELADRSITHPKGVAEDVFIKVGKFHFLTDFVVVDFEADPRVPRILGRSFLRTDRALIDVYLEEITLRVNDEAITFNLNQTTRYSSTYDDFLVNRFEIVDVAREEYAQEIIGFSNNSLGGNPTSTSKPILSDSSPSLTPFEGSDFILEEIKAYLKDESILPEIDHVDCEPKGDICLIEKLLNDDPFQLPPMDLKQGEVVKAKSLIEEPPKLELKDLPSHLEYAYLEGVDKLPVIIAKDLKVYEKEALLKVLKSHKRAIAWKITDIKGIDPRFCTHKILREEDYKPAVQTQRRVNPKIHKVIKKEVIKLLNAGMIYLISDSLWVSPMHCIPKKGGITVVENENNELIPTRLPGGEFVLTIGS